ncbi:MAG: hypothetical protein ACKOXO_02745 [Cyanobium sp.]
MRPLNPLRRLLLVPVLAPLLALLLLAALNPRPSLSLRLLTARTAALPLGLWLAAGGIGGAALSALTTTLALRQAGHAPRRGGRPLEPEPWASPPAWDEQGAPQPRRCADRQPAADEGWREAGPARAPGEPPPTVSVPFRVIRRPATASAPPHGSGLWEDGLAPASAQRGDGGADDWQEPHSDDW